MPGLLFLYRTGKLYRDTKVHPGVCHCSKDGQIGQLSRNNSLQRQTNVKRISRESARCVYMHCTYTYNTVSFPLSLIISKSILIAAICLNCLSVVHSEKYQY